MKWSTKSGHRVKALNCHNEVSDDNRKGKEAELHGRIGRYLPIAETISRTVEGRLIGESGHRNFDAKPRAYEFANGCLRPKADVQTIQFSGN